jgi:nucleotide-binding universal stress UspA family protein
VLPTRDSLVVGVDGSMASGPTIRWATVEAAARRASLHIVSFASDGLEGDGGRRESRDILLDEAATSDLVVVGASTLGAATRWLRICVPRGGSRHSSCPIVVVRGDASQPLRRIVVGIDSPSTPGGLVDWAADEAGHHDAELVIVHAWQPNRQLGHSVRDNDLARADARCVVDLTVRRCETRSRCAVRGELIEGEPADVLSAASRGADLIVVGSRGRSGFTTMLFGSVAASIVELADCPVAVIPPRVRSTAPQSVVCPDATDLDDAVWVSRP